MADWAPGCVYNLLTLLFLYCALLAQIRCKRLTNTLLHYIYIAFFAVYLLFQCCVVA